LKNPEEDDGKLSGPKRSKAAILELEQFLKEHCKEPQLVSEIVKKFQYQTGHAPPKTREYMRSIETTGKIRLFMNSGDLYVQRARRR
jgi:hypothetical protein